MSEDPNPTVTVDSPETAEPQSAIADDGTPVEGEPTQPEETWDSWEAFTESHHFAPVKELYKAHHDEKERETYKSAWENYQQSLEPIQREQAQRIQHVQGLYQTVNDGLSTINGRLKKLQEEGALDAESFTETLKSHTPTWQALQAIGQETQRVAHVQGHQDGYIEGVKGGVEDIVQQISAEVGDPKLLELKPRIQAVLDGKEPSKAFVKSLADSLINIGFQKGLREGRKAANESSKLANRNEGGPDTSNLSGSAGGPLTPKTYRERLARGETPTPEEVDAMTKRLLVTR